MNLLTVLKSVVLNNTKPLEEKEKIGAAGRRARTKRQEKQNQKQKIQNVMVGKTGYSKCRL